MRLHSLPYLLTNSYSICLAIRAKRGAREHVRNRIWLAQLVFSVRKPAFVPTRAARPKLAHFRLEKPWLRVQQCSQLR